MKLGLRLLILTVATLLPLVVFSISAILLVAQHQRRIFERSATERTRALLTAVDAELQGHFVTLRALATSRALETGDLASFHEEARRTVAIEPRWSSVRVSVAPGRRILDTDVPFGHPLPNVDDLQSFEEAVRTGRPTVGEIFLNGKRHHFHVRIPVLSGGQEEAILSALVDPEAILSMLERQRLPSSWVGVVLDENRNIVARTVHHEALVGDPASESLRAALDRSSEGWFQGNTIEGTGVYTPYTRSPVTGWTVAMGIPTGEVEAGARQTAWMLALGMALATVVASALAFGLGRGIASPIMALRAAANALARSAPVDPPGTGGVEEVDEVRRAMVEASRMVREREDALRSADRAKDEFLAMLGHELRNPLNAIGSAAQILQLSRPEGEHADSAVGIITRQVHHMRRLVDDLLDVSRVTSGRVKLSLQRIDLASRVRAALESLRASGRLEGHELRFELAPVWIDADAARIEQIVVNLVGNAAKYTPPGGSIDVRVRQEGRQAVLEVVDTGRGLSPELLPRVFDLFVQGQRSLDRSEGGLGIGLTLVKRLVELHGGTVHAASEGPERGARFSVRLPAVEAPASLPRDEAGAEAEIEPQRILVVEDNDDARQALVGALRLRGHETFEAPDGPAGLARAADCRPDVVIVDIGLPGIDGYEVGKRLRQTPGGAELVLLALTGYGQEESRQRALASGFDAFFIKPLSPERLLRRIASIRSERAHGVDDP